MGRPWFAPIVEGQGEYERGRILLERIWRELLDGEYVEVIKPIRRKRISQVQPEGLRDAVPQALGKLKHLPPSNVPALVLILVDADRDCPGQLGPKWLELARASHTHADVARVAARVESGTWLIAAAESLRDFLDLPADFGLSGPPEDFELSKGWIERRFQGTQSSETQDQPAMTRAMDLSLCRAGSPSFDQLCRELERRAS